MPTRLLSRLAVQPVLNTLAAAAMLLSAPAFSPAADNEPPSVVIALAESAPAAQLAPQLPLELTFTDRMGTAEFAPLSGPLTIGGAAHMSDYRAGDVAYLASEQSVIVFVSDGMAVPVGDLVLLGHVTSGLDEMASCVRDCVVQRVAGADDY